MDGRPVCAHDIETPTTQRSRREEDPNERPETATLPPSPKGASHSSYSFFFLRCDRLWTDKTPPHRCSNFGRFALPLQRSSSRTHPLFKQKKAPFLEGESAKISFSFLVLFPCRNRCRAEQNTASHKAEENGAREKEKEGGMNAIFPLPIIHRPRPNSAPPSPFPHFLGSFSSLPLSHGGPLFLFLVTAFFRLFPRSRNAPQGRINPLFDGLLFSFGAFLLFKSWRRWLLCAVKTISGDFVQSHFCLLEAFLLPLAQRPGGLW